VVNILKVVGVITEHEGKFLKYDPSMLEGDQAAEARRQEARQRDCEAELDQLKDRVEAKLQLFRAQIRQIIMQKRLLKRNTKLNELPVEE